MSPGAVAYLLKPLPLPVTEHTVRTAVVARPAATQTSGVSRGASPAPPLYLRQMRINARWQRYLLRYQLLHEKRLHPSADGTPSSRMSAS